MALVACGCGPKEITISRMPPLSCEALQWQIADARNGLDTLNAQEASPGAGTLDYLLLGLGVGLSLGALVVAPEYFFAAPAATGWYYNTQVSHDDRTEKIQRLRIRVAHLENAWQTQKCASSYQSEI